MNKPIRYNHPVRVYVPVYQKGNTFTYSYADATQDEQLAWSLEPDYVLELNGHFDATTDPLKETNEHSCTDMYSNEDVEKLKEELKRLRKENTNLETKLKLVIKELKIYI